MRYVDIPHWNRVWYVDALPDSHHRRPLSGQRGKVRGKFPKMVLEALGKVKDKRDSSEAV